MARDKLKKITVRVREADYDALCEMFPPPVGYNKAIRQILQTQVRILQEDINKQREAEAAATEEELSHVRIPDPGLDPQQSDESPTE